MEVGKGAARGCGRAGVEGWREGGGRKGGGARGRLCGAVVGAGTWVGRSKRVGSSGVAKGARRRRGGGRRLNRGEKCSDGLLASIYIYIYIYIYLISYTLKT